MFTAALLAVAFAADPKPRLDADGIPLPAEALRRFGSAKFCTDPPKSVAFSSDGKVVYLVRADVAAWPDEKVPAASAWELATGRKVWEFHSADLRGQQVATDQDGKSVWLVGHVRRGKPAKTSFVRLKLDASTGKELSRSTLHPGRSMASDLRPDGTLAWACYDEERSDLSLPVTNPDGSEAVRWDPEGHDIQLVRFAPDGKTVYLGGARFDNEKEWKLAAVDVTKRKPLWSVKCPPIDTLAVSSDGKAVAVTAQGKTTKRADFPTTTTVMMFAADDGHELGSLDLGGKHHRLFRSNYLGFGRPLAFTPDAKTLLVMSDERNVLPIDTATWKAGEPRTDGAVYGWHTPDGKAYLHPAGRNLTVHDAKTHRPLAQSPAPLDRPNNSLPRLAFTADGKQLTRRGDRWVAWDVATGAEVEQVSWETACENGQAARANYGFSTGHPVASPDGKRSLHPTTARDGKTVGFEVIDLASGKATAELTDMPLYTRLAFTPDGKHVVSGNFGQAVTVWDVATGGKPERATPDPLRKGGGSIDSLRVHPSSKQVALLEAFDDAANPKKWQIGRYDLAPLKRVKGWTGDGYVAAFEYTRGGKLVGITERARLAPDGPGDLFVIDPDADAVIVYLLDVHGLALAVSPDGRTAAVGVKSGEIHLYELASGKRRHTFRGLKRPALSLAFSPDGRALASESADGPVILWDVQGAAQK